MNYLSIPILVAYVYLLFFKIKDNEYLKMLVLTFVTAATICYFKNVIEGLENSNDKAGDFGSASSEVAQSPADNVPAPKIVRKKQLVSPIDSKLRMGPYDGLCIRTLNQRLRDLSNNKLVSNDKLMTYLGVQGPVQNVVSDDSDLSGPTVDGDPKSPQRLFMFANNKASLNCCPSTYSTDRGCVCSTEKQDDYITRRGFNNSANNVA